MLMTLALSVTALTLFLAQHPFFTYPLSLRALRAFNEWSSHDKGRHGKRSLEPQAGQGMRISLMICAHNERANICAKLDNARSIKERHNNVEVLVHDDGSADGTTDILKAALEDGVIDRAYLSPTRDGKIAGINRLMDIATGDILVVTDANVILAEGTIQALLDAFADPGVGCACGRCLHFSARMTATSRNSLAYRAFEENLNELETATGSKIMADGALFAFSRKVAEHVPAGLSEDLWIPIRTLAMGLRTVSVPNAIAEEAAPTTTRAEVSRKIRIATQNYHGHKALKKASYLNRLSTLDLYKYFSHKFLKWISPLLFATAALSSTLALGESIGWAIILPGMVAGTLACLLAIRLPIKGLTRLMDAMICFFAAGYGFVAAAMTGRTIISWHRSERAVPASLDLAHPSEESRY